MLLASIVLRQKVEELQEKFDVYENHIYVLIVMQFPYDLDKFMTRWIIVAT